MGGFFGARTYDFNFQQRQHASPEYAAYSGINVKFSGMAIDVLGGNVKLSLYFHERFTRFSSWPLTDYLH